MNLTSGRLFFLWSVIGPLLALATLLLMLYNPTPLTPFFALTMACGIPACWYLKKWGAVIAAFVLTFLIFFNANAMAEAPIWHIGIALSITLTLFITNSSFEETASIAEEFSVHSTSSQKTLEQHKLDLENLNFKHQNELQTIQKKMDAYSQELKDAVEKAKMEVLIARKDSDQTKNEAESFRRELEAKTIKEEHVLQELLEKRKEVFQLRDQLQETQEELKNRPKEMENDQDNTELQNLQDLISKKEQDLFNIQFRLDSALEDIQKQEKELSKFHDVEIMQKKLQLEMSDKIETLKREKELFELTINKLQHETEQLFSLKQEKEKLEDSLNTTLKELENVRNVATQEAAKEHPAILSDPILSQESGLRRRAEGMYLQLKEQFIGKSATLDETRRQLFHTQESLLQLQRNLKESEQYSPNPQVQSMTRHILKMQNQFDRKEKIYFAEIDILHDIITKLNEGVRDKG